jgi:UDP-N-acetylmuramyl pentapeptide phosphotransferase/UDP-N-acetylglucosamine-1-phosphate transferase
MAKIDILITGRPGDAMPGGLFDLSELSLPVSLTIAVAAAALTYGGIAGVIGWLNERAVARPNQRSSHTVPTPQGGGIVVVPVALLTGGVALAVSAGALPGGARSMAVVGAAALALTIIGFLDDMRGLGVVTRFATQFLAVGVAMLLLPADVRILPPFIPLPVERMVAVGAVLWFVNLFNFMDGIDLISAVETVAITLGIALLAALGLIATGYGYAALALLGAMLGFAPWNAPRARLFLGDAGSIPIGFLLGILLVHVAASNALAAALIFPLYYLADATITLLRRLARREAVWQAHRQHFYQQATRNGFTVTEIVGRIALLDAVLVALGVGSALHGKTWAGIALLVAAVAVGLTLRTFAGPRR